MVPNNLIITLFIVNCIDCRSAAFVGQTSVYIIYTAQKDCVRYLDVFLLASADDFNTCAITVNRIWPNLQRAKSDPLLNTYINRVASVRAAEVMKRRSVKCLLP